MKKKVVALCVKANSKVNSFRKNVSGSETTEKIGMVVIAIVIVGLLAAGVEAFMPGLFDSIFDKAKTALESIF